LQNLWRHSLVPERDLAGVRKRPEGAYG
jgi:hypothetical protein